ncbi:MAG TPA: hypothetical protein VNU24_05725, partial [Solirubrobacteraceae bacterium]|nr:hypothetical protein [Solirubrobacteraceae bacterium]
MSAIRLVERLVLVALLAIVLLGVGIGFGVGGLESRFSSASDQRGELPQTRLTALPHRAVIDGTLPLRVRLSAPPASFSPRPTLSPAIAGNWSTRGDSEIFTPSSTLDPCADYTLTVPAASSAVAHSPLGRPRTVALSVQCPSVRGLQQTLARLGYLPYGAHSSIRAREFRDDVAAAQTDATGATSAASSSTTAAQASLAGVSATEVDRRVAAIDAFDPSPDAPVAHVSDAPPLEYGQLDETTKGALTVFQSEHE